MSKSPTYLVQRDAGHWLTNGLEITNVRGHASEYATHQRALHAAMEFAARRALKWKDSSPDRFGGWRIVQVWPAIEEREVSL